MKRVVISGGAGFIGAHVVHRFGLSKWRIVVIDNLSTGLRDRLPAESPTFHFFKMDVENVPRDTLNGSMAVIHLAARTSVEESIRDPEGNRLQNLDRTLFLANQCREAGVRRFVFASSASVYGDLATDRCSEGDKCRPISPYARHKLEAEEALRGMASSSFQVLCLRPFNVYGPGQRSENPYSGVISKFIEDSSKGRFLEIHGDGEQTRDFVFVKDVAEGFFSAVTAPLADPYHVINLGTGVAISVASLSELIAAEASNEIHVKRRMARSGDVRHSRASVVSARKILGWTAKTNLRDGIRETIAWKNTTDPDTRRESQ